MNKQSKTNSNTNKNNIKNNSRKTPSHTKTKALSKNTGVVNGQQLDERHKLVIDEFHNNGRNRSKAVLEHYPEITNQSVRCQIFNSIINSSQGKKYVQNVQSQLRAANHISREQTLQEFTSFAFADATNYIGLTEDEVKKLEPSVRRAIQSYKVTERTETDRKGNDVTVKTIDLKLVNKLDALKEVTKIIGGYELDNQQKQNTLDISKLPTADQLTLLKILTKSNTDTM